MKKLFLVAAATTLFTATAYAKEDVWYLSADFGGAYLPKTKEHNTGVKLKSKNIPVLSVAIGYGLADNFRASLDFTHYFTPELKRTVKFDKNGNGFNGTTKHKISADTLMFKGIVDLFEADSLKFFVGAGAGLARLNEKTTASGTTTNRTNNETTTITPTSYSYKYSQTSNSETKTSTKAKNKTNFAFTVLTGLSYEISTGVNMDLTYSYSDLGKTKFKTHVQAHDIKVGIRFDI